MVLVSLCCLVLFLGVCLVALVVLAWLQVVEVFEVVLLVFGVLLVGLSAWACLGLWGTLQAVFGVGGLVVEALLVEWAW